MRAAVVVAAIASAATTAALALFAQPDRGSPWQSEHLALEVAASLIALLACFLVYGRFRRRATLYELMLACALVVFALFNSFMVSVPVVAGWAPADLTVWAAPTARCLGALLFLFAAFGPNRPLWRPGLALAVGAGGVTAALLLITIAAYWFARRSPQAVTASWAQSAPELTMAVLFGVAAVRFLQRSRRLNDEFLGWLAIAAVLASASHFNYFLHPGINSQSVYSGDAFGVACYVALLLGSTREVVSYWHALPETAVIEERRRIACELHDGVAQELAYLQRNLDSLSGSVDEDDLAKLRRAVERARVESRRAISALAAPCDQPFEVAVAEAVTEVAERHHVEPRLHLARNVRLSPERREALVRIACEAVTNAARHSGTDRVNIWLERSGSVVRLRISDSGQGFDIGAAGNGFGLISMNERAHAVGGELLVSSAPGHGCQVEVAV